MNNNFFIQRPIFTSVCSFVIIVLGLICIPILPVSQYPQLAPPTITVTATYTGASSEIVESAVTKPLEEAINGVEEMKYMTSQSGNDGVCTIQITFNLGRDEDIAAVDVQNRISPVLGTLPQEVQKTGVSISKQTPAIVAAIALYSEKGEYDDIFISNYADNYITEPIKRIEGVGSASIAGVRTYSMRLWLDPAKLAARGLTASDVVSAIQEQNQQVPAGQIGQPPNPENQQYQISVKVYSRLSKPEEFENLVLKQNNDGSLVKVRDVGHVELGSEDYSTNLKFKGKNAVGILIYQLSDANALQVYDQTVKAMEKLKESFPPGLNYEVAFETVTFVKESINEVVFTLVLAIILVICVIFGFLQSWRTTLIPLITIPVSLIGTFLFIKIFGFSINTLTLFGIVLATGIVVDDAIVVVENIERCMEEHDMTPFEAACFSMKEVAAAIAAAALVLGAVFLPVAFFPGTTGQLYKQFALTIVFSVMISLFNALTLSPAIAALVLKKERVESKGILKKIDQFINFTRDTYHKTLTKVINHKAIVLVVFVLLFGGIIYLFGKVPGGFVPDEDQGYFITTVQAPEGASLNYTQAVMDKYVGMLESLEETKSTFALSGYSFTGNGANKGMIFTKLKDMHERKGKQHSVGVLVNKMNRQAQGITEAIIVNFQPPAIQGIGNVGGFQFELIDEGSHTLNELQEAADSLIAAGYKTDVLTGLFTSFTADSPQLNITILRDKAKRLGVSLDSIFTSLQVYLGSMYVNDFDFIEKVYRVYVQADKNFRDNPMDLNEFYVRSDVSGEMIPMSSLIDLGHRYTAQTITHFNLFRSAEINGSQAHGYSSGQAINEMEKLAKENLPSGMSYQWAGISLEQIQSGSQGIIMFSLGILFVYLFLAAQYESLIDPVIIILAVPLAIFGALMAQLIRGLENDVFCQIGMVMLVGLACKNSILIVEFANQLMEQGKNATEAVLEAAKTRYRPIMMTSMAFILGVFPLVVATGAGAGSRNSMGTAVFGGMIFATFVSLFLVPVLFLVLKRFSKKKYPSATEIKEQ